MTCISCHDSIADGTGTYTGNGLACDDCCDEAFHEGTSLEAPVLLDQGSAIAGFAAGFLAQAAIDPNILFLHGAERDNGSIGCSLSPRPPSPLPFSKDRPSGSVTRPAKSLWTPATSATPRWLPPSRSALASRTAGSRPARGDGQLNVRCSDEDAVCLARVEHELAVPFERSGDTVGVLDATDHPSAGVPLDPDSVWDPTLLHGPLHRWGAVLL